MHDIADTDTNYHCPVCKRPFKRLDLLHRHEKRAICGGTVPSHLASYKKRKMDSPGADDFDSPSTHSNSTSPFNLLPGLSTTRSPGKILNLSLDPRSSTSSHFPHLAPITSHMGASQTSLPSASSIDPSAPLISPSITMHPHDMPSHNGYSTNPFQALPDFEMSTTTNSQDWGLNLWQPDPWDALLHDTLAPPFNEPVLELDLPWNVPTPRMQESAERGGESLASAALIAKLQLSIPVSPIFTGLSLKSRNST